MFSGFTGKPEAKPPFYVVLFFVLKILFLGGPGPRKTHTHSSLKTSWATIVMLQLQLKKNEQEPTGVSLFLLEDTCFQAYRL